MLPLPRSLLAGLVALAAVPAAAQTYGSGDQALAFFDTMCCQAGDTPIDQHTPEIGLRWTVEGTTDDALKPKITSSRVNFEPGSNAVAVAQGPTGERTLRAVVREPDGHAADVTVYLIDRYTDAQTFTALRLRWPAAGTTLDLDAIVALQRGKTGALIGWAALGHNDRIGGLVFADDEHHEVKPRRSKQSLLQLLNLLARANQALGPESQANLARDNFGLALRRAREVLRPGSLVIVLCDERALSDNAEQQLSLLARHTDLLLLPMSDPLDHALPAAGLLRFTQGGMQLEVDSHNGDLRQAYRAQAQAREARWQRLAQKLGVPLLPLSTQFELIEQLQEQLGALHPRKTL